MSETERQRLFARGSVPAATEVPRVVIAGSASGVGKTTVTVALIDILRRRGLRVAAFKAGPDYLDPQWLKVAAGGDAVQLDPWLMGREGVLRTFARHAQGADIAIVEGMMGLFDGIQGHDNAGSTAQLAQWLKAPVVLVVDAAAMARSFAAAVSGFAAFPGAPEIAGAIATRVGGAGHVALLRKALESAPGHIPLVGAVPRLTTTLGERHLGLVPPEEAETTVEQLALQVAPYLDVEALQSAAGRAPALPAAPPAAVRSLGAARIAVAYDAAFSFYYPENLALLRQAGAELVMFSPLHDDLPDADALYIGGGYPECHAERLAQRVRLRRQVAAFAQERPVLAECGGLMWLAREVRTSGGQCYPMCGVFPFSVRVMERLQAIGYVRLRYEEDHWSGLARSIRYGHQFRYSEVVGAPTERWFRVAGTDGPFRTGAIAWRRGPAVASWIHQHWARTPEAAERFVAAAREGTVRAG